MQPNEKPHLTITTTAGQPTDYQCSECGQVFLLPEDRSPKEAAIELLQAFHEHVAEEHAQEAKD
jgi:hypothetical protein